MKQQKKHQRKTVVSKSVGRKKSVVFRILFSIRGIAVLTLLLAAALLPQFWQSEHPCANSISCANNLDGSYQPNDTTGVFMGKTVTSPKQQPDAAFLPSVLGDSTLPKIIKVDLSSQHLYAYEGSNLVYDFVISSGKWHPTPTGTFSIWIKLRYTRMTGGSKILGDYYDLPNVPYTMYFYNQDIAKAQGYSIHGAYWHNNFGHPMSHGCINMKIPDAKKMYDWANPPTDGFTTYATEQNPGTQVIIYGTTPAS